MFCADFSPSLSELVDGTLSREAKGRVESHLEACAECRALLADLRRIRESARALPKSTPPESVWQKVRADFDAETGRATRLPVATRTQASPAPATRLHAASDTQASSSPETRLHAVSRTPASSPASSAGDRPLRVPGFVPRRRSVLAGLAAAAVLVLAASAGLYYMTRPAAPAPLAAPTSAHVEPAQSVQSIEAELDLADQHYEKAIAGLEQAARDGQASLDPQTADVLQKNIGVIDQAIRESRAALRSQPTNEVAQSSLFEALQRKVGLLRDTIALINEMRKGDQAGTAKIVGGIGKG
jgi:anti-sigma factor RsiW